ncbi:MAG TPA: protein tyrosine phosphatase family protein [Anaerolineales bacterium]|nr:protein tyrosine phosphatase family protein [Anaerolineales bacterium]
MFEDIHNFLALSETLFTGGMPKADQLRDAARQGVQVVINLAPHDVPDALPNETELVNSLGLQYINIPVNWNTPTKEGLDRFMDAMDENKDRVILVHCEANFRASAFVSMYRILRQGWQPEDAFEVMHKIWDEDSYPVWKMFIEDTLKRSWEGR